MKRSHAVAVLACLSVAACGAPVDDVSLDAPRFARAELRASNDQYIVVFNDDAIAPDFVDDDIADTARTHRAEVVGRFSHAVRGYTARMSESAAIALSKDPRVALVEEDGVVEAVATEANATWGIDRIDQRALPLSTTYTYNSNGSGVSAYIIDTGIRTTHSEFGGRASSGYTAVTDGNGTNDCNGHGTHVSGTVGGSVYGVAKGVSLVAVRVLDCNGSGTTSGVIAGIDWVTKNHAAKAVANMSLGGGASTALDTAVVNSINAGVTYAIAAGNSNARACSSSPARVPAAITVGATTSTDARASYSNYGTCLDLFAPGSNITSAWNTSDSATNTISGTSMATPHVTGVAALYVGSHTGTTPASVATAIVSNATSGVVTGAKTGSPNKLLYSLIP
jgi:subtilisin family serine protease